MKNLVFNFQAFWPNNKILLTFTYTIKTLKKLKLKTFIINTLKRVEIF